MPNKILFHPIETLAKFGVVQNAVLKYFSFEAVKLDQKFN